MLSSKKNNGYSNNKQEVVSITYEEIGLFPRSFSRVLDRFLKQVFSDVEHLVIQEYRFYRYLFLTTVRSLLILFFVPFLINFLAKTYVIRPLTEYFWNTKQTEIFLNSYQEAKAFTELKDFEEKLYFESLIYPKERSASSLPTENSSTIKGGDINFQQNLTLYAAPPLHGNSKHEPSSVGTERSAASLVSSPTAKRDKVTPRDAPSLSREMQGVGTPVFGLSSLRSTASDDTTVKPGYPVQDSLAGYTAAAHSNMRDTTQECGYFPSNSSKEWLLHTCSQKDKMQISTDRKTLFLKDSLKEPAGLHSALGQGLVLVPARVSPEVTQAPKAQARSSNPSIVLPTATHVLVPPHALSDQALAPRDSARVSPLVTREIRSEIDSHTQISRLSSLSPGYPVTQAKTIFHSNNLKSSLFVYQTREAKKNLHQRYQEKILALAQRYNNQSIEAITNFFGDVVSLLTLFYLLYVLEIQINITKSFLLEVFFGLDDSKKSLLILLITDLLVGYHSSNLWELFFEFLFNHYGFPESQTGIFLLVATLPVLLDVLFKYLIFRHLNRSSPATVATYHAMIE